jgi:hypothetical protein
MGDPIVFWTAFGAVGTSIGALGAAAGAWMIRAQIIDARKVGAYDFVRREDDRFNSSEMKQVRAALANMLIMKLDNKHVDDSTYDYYAQMVLDHFEALGSLVHDNLAPEDLVWILNSWWTFGYWTGLKGYILEFRNSRADNSYYSEFEYLFNRMTSIEKKRRGRQGYPINDKELRDFLIAEKNDANRPV